MVLQSEKHDQYNYNKNMNHIQTHPYDYGITAPICVNHQHHQTEIKDVREEQHILMRTHTPFQRPVINIRQPEFTF